MNHLYLTRALRNEFYMIFMPKCQKLVFYAPSLGFMVFMPTANPAYAYAFIVIWPIMLWHLKLFLQIQVTYEPSLYSLARLYWPTDNNS